MQWIRRARFRALAYVLAITLAAAATIAFGGVPWLPVVGAAVVTAAVSMSKLTTKLLKPTCMECGRDLSGEPIGMQGIACPDCGSVQMPNLVDLARMVDRPDSSADTDDQTESA
jgi:phosphotransferase system  glucose/maltose/N-acetylglucosamine-specific IIC component